MANEKIIAKAEEMMAAPSCRPALREKAQAWLDKQDAASARALIAEIEADLMPIDGLLAFTSSPRCAEVLGAERAKALAAHAEALRAAGAQWCDCPACAAGLAILAEKDELLG